jgi:hypothetical protein
VLAARRGRRRLRRSGHRHPLHRTLDVRAVRQVVGELVAANLATSTSPGSDGAPVWQVDGWPPIRCAGVHVERLGEIGPVSLCVKPTGSSGVRLYASCVSAGSPPGLERRPNASGLRLA